MRLFGWTLIAIGLLIAFGLPSMAVLQNKPFDVWQILLPLVGGGLLAVLGRIVGTAPTGRRSR